MRISNAVLKSKGTQMNRKNLSCYISGEIFSVIRRFLTCVLNNSIIPSLRLLYMHPYLVWIRAIPISYNHTIYSLHRRKGRTKNVLPQPFRTCYWFIYILTIIQNNNVTQQAPSPSVYRNPTRKKTCYLSLEKTSKSASKVQNNCLINY